MDESVSMPGGLSRVNNSDENIQNIVNNLKNDIELKSGKKCNDLKVIKYKTQVVSGTNYFVKVHVGGEKNKEYIHLRIFMPLPCHGNKAKLDSIQLNHSADSLIEHF